MNGVSPHTTLSEVPSSRCADGQPVQIFDTVSMKAEVCWENHEKSVIRYTFSGIWNWDDFYYIIEQRDATTLLRSVDVIVDFRGITAAPSDAILHLKRAAKMTENDNNAIVLITNSATIVTLYHAFIAMYKSIGKRLRIVNTDAEARAVLGMNAPD